MSRGALTLEPCQHGEIAGAPEETMKRSSKTVAWLAVLAAFGVLLTPGPLPAADRVPGPEATSGASGSASNQANYQADYHADYRVKSADEPAKGTEDSDKDVTLDSRRREQQREDRQRDWRSSPTMDRLGRTPSAWPR